MIELEAFLVALTADIPALAGGPARGVEVAVTALDVSLPLETRFADGGRLLVSAPRGRWQAGFQVPHGAFHASFHRVEQP